MIIDLSQIFQQNRVVKPAALHGDKTFSVRRERQAGCFGYFFVAKITGILDPRTNIKYLFINGRMLPLTSRHTELYEAFKDRK
ncbi:MAG TPA: hypothetical protein VK892_01590 [Pyrinomonadaceae bacterium]|nr:hypothetical protein [Pyrinomonadaceae bacterium]